MVDIEQPPSYPMFAPPKNNRKMQESPVKNNFSSQFYPMIYPMYRPPYQQNNYTINISSSPSSSPTRPINLQPKDIPPIDDFLKTLDQKHGDGLFTQFLDNFIDESIDVLDISVLNDSDFNSLGVEKIGIRKKMIRETKKI